MTSELVDNYYRSAFNVLKGTNDDGIAENPESLGVEAEGDYTVKFTFKTEKDPDSVLNAFLSFLIRAITHPSTVLLSGRLRSAVGLLNT